MGLNNKYISIALTTIIASLVIYQLQARNTYEDEIIALKQSQTTALQLSQDTIAQLQLTIATLNQQLTAARKQPADSNHTADVAAASPPASANSPVQTLQDRIRNMMNTPAIQQATSNMMVNNLYGDFIRGLHLSAAEKESLSQILASSMSKKTDLALQLSAGKINKADYDTAIKEVDGKLRDSLSGYLYQQELIAFDQYEATREIRTATKARQAQELALERGAPELNKDSRSYVARVLLEEARKSAQTSGGAATPPQSIQDLSGMMDARNQQMDTALQRIKTEGGLDKNQMSAVEEYINQQKSMGDMAGQMMTTLLKK